MAIIKNMKTISVITVYNRVVAMTQRTDLVAGSGTFHEILEESIQEINRRHGLVKYSTNHTIDSSDQFNDIDNVFEIEVNAVMINMKAINSFLTADYLIYDDEVMTRLTIEEVLADERTGYCEYNGKIYICGVDVGDEVIIHYTGAHATPVIDIYFPIHYQAAVIYLIVAKLYENYEILDKAQYYRQLYENEMIRNGRDNSLPAICKSGR